MSFYVLLYSGFWDPDDSAEEQLEDIRHAVKRQMDLLLDTCEDNSSLSFEIETVATKVSTWTVGQPNRMFDNAQMWESLHKMAERDFLRTVRLLPSATAYETFIRVQSATLAEEYSSLSDQEPLLNPTTVPLSVMRQRRAQRLERFLQSPRWPFLPAEGLSFRHNPCWLLKLTRGEFEPNVIARLQVKRGHELIEPEIY